MKIYSYTQRLFSLLPRHSPSHLTLSFDSISPDDIIFHSPKSGLRVRHWQILELLSDNGKTMICTDIVDAWLELLVDYANCNTCNNLTVHTNQDLEGTDTESEKGRRQTETEEEKPYYVLPIPVTDTIFRDPTPTTHLNASTYLHQHSLSPPQLLKASTILLPLDIPIGGIAGHSILIAIYPQRNMISLHDSWRPKHRSRARRIVRDLVCFLEGYLGVMWEPGEWRWKIAKGSWQRNRVDCGVWVCVNAWDVVMGVEREGVGLLNARLRRGCDIRGMRRKMFVDISRGGLSDEEMEIPVLLLGKNAEDEADSGSFEGNKPAASREKAIWRSTCSMISPGDIWQTITGAKEALMLPPYLRLKALKTKVYKQKIEIQ